MPFWQFFPTVLKKTEVMLDAYMLDVKIYLNAQAFFFVDYLYGITIKFYVFIIGITVNNFYSGSDILSRLLIEVECLDSKSKFSSPYLKNVPGITWAGTNVLLTFQPELCQGADRGRGGRGHPEPPPGPRRLDCRYLGGGRGGDGVVVGDPGGKESVAVVVGRVDAVIVVDAHGTWTELPCTETSQKRNVLFDLALVS